MGREFKKFFPQTEATTFAFPSVFILLLCSVVFMSNLKFFFSRKNFIKYHVDLTKCFLFFVVSFLEQKEQDPDRNFIADLDPTK